MLYIMFSLELKWRTDIFIYLIIFFIGEIHFDRKYLCFWL